ncbi:1457_t:CDS:2, partial [Funneliformis mosseae]
KYWNRDPNLWGCLNDWDIYFIENVNGCTKHDAHRSLSFELDILLVGLPVDSRGYSKAVTLRKSLEEQHYRALQLLLSDFSHKARCFLPEVG